MARTDRPAVVVPDGPPPGELVVEDLEQGSGAEAISGTTVTVNYVGVAWSTRAEFDSSWGRGEPFSFRLGKAQVIRGWEQGLLGMREGGRRRLVIPPHLAYGSSGSGLFIKPNESLVFVIDLITVAEESSDGFRSSRLRRLFGGR
jgi:peptidylprolyl isomerase